MTFYEKELRKIMEPIDIEATYVGRACYIKLGEHTRARLNFITGRISNQYDALLMTVLNPTEGKVDTLALRFEDVIGKKMVSNPNFRDGVLPHFWDNDGKISWYVYQPTANDYGRITDAVNSYLDVFIEPEMHQAKGMEMQL